MKCPGCGFENVSGIDECQDCGTSLTGLDAKGTDIEQSLAAHPISALCPREPICVSPETPVGEVIRKMAEQRQGCVLVESDARLVGVFSDRDVLNRVAAETTNFEQPVSRFMTTNPTTVKQRDSIGFALQTMDLGGYRHLPIVNSSNIAVGLLSARDILRYLSVRYAGSRG